MALTLIITMTLPQVVGAVAETSAVVEAGIEANADTTVDDLAANNSDVLETTTPEVTSEPLIEEVVLPTEAATTAVAKPESLSRTQAVGWILGGDKFKYYVADSGYVKQDWRHIGGKWYYFAEDEFMVTGWLTEGNNIYFLNRSKGSTEGQMKIGWEAIDGYWYYFESSGALTGGWRLINNRWYHFQPRTGAVGTAGRMNTGWLTEGNTIYFLNETKGSTEGQMKTDWERKDGHWYYFNQSGDMATGWKLVGKHWYYLNPTGTQGVKGRLLTGWLTEGNATYFLSDASGSTEGQMKTSWDKREGYWYYFDNNGALATGWRLVAGQWYYLREDGSNGVKGRMHTGWLTSGGKRYYLNKANDGVEGMMAKGWRQIDGKQCYFDSSGAYDENKKSTKIAIDAGHQRHGDSSLEPIGPGSSQRKPKVSSGTYGKWSRLNEYELNLTVSLKLKAELLKRGYEVYMIRETHDVNISNSQRAKNAIAAGSDILVRIHANGDSNSSVAGALTMAPGNNNTFLTSANIKNSQKLSTDIINEFCAATGARNRGVQYHNDMTGINWSSIPVTIMEMGFMSNQSDDLNMANNAYQDKMVQGIANGIDRYYR